MSVQPKLVVSGIALATPEVGQNVYTCRLLAALAKQSRVDFVVVAPEGIARPVQVAEKNFVSVPRSCAPRNALASHVITCQRLLDFVRRRFPDALFHSPGPIFGLRKPRRTVVTLHDCLYRHFPNYNGRFFVRRILSRAAERFAARASLVLTDSEFSRRDLVKNAGIPSCKVEVVYPWVGSEFLAPIDPVAVQTVRSKFRLPERFWLYLGGYDYRKNIEFLLQAYAAASRTTVLPPLLLAGKVPTERHRAICDVNGALLRLGLTSKAVLCPGIIPGGDLPALYRAAALLIYPSLMEGFGLPPAEAMAVGTPVLASNTSSLPEVVRSTHSLFGPRDSAALASKLVAAAKEEAQFTVQLPEAFTEAHGISRYLGLLGELR